VILLLEHRRTCRAQASLLPAQAGGDGPRVGDFAGAKPVDVGRAGPALLGRALLCVGHPRRKQCDEETEYRGPAHTAPQRRDSCHSCVHDCVSLIRPNFDSAGVIRANTRNNFREM
jgi:hypothetical protein